MFLQNFCKKPKDWRPPQSISLRPFAHGAASVTLGSSGSFAALVTDDRFRSARRSLQHA